MRFARRVAHSPAHTIPYASHVVSTTDSAKALVHLSAVSYRRSN